MSIQQTREQNQVAESGQVTERFNTAIGNLESESMDIRLGGIYALQRLMHDSPRDQIAIITILAAYVRGHDRPLKEPPSPLTLDAVKGRAGVSLHLVPDDVEAAVRVLADRDVAHDGMAHNGQVVTVIDLSGAHLEGVDLSDSSFEFANFTGAHLDYARLRDTHLVAANFEGAHLSYTDLMSADIRSTSFRKAQLKKADFRNSDAKDADFSGALSAHYALAAGSVTGAYFVRTETCRGRIPTHPAKKYVCQEHLM
ncbi:pentapeptide repeat-containing protein [Streptomyces griseoluteus]